MRAALRAVAHISQADLDAIDALGPGVMGPLYAAMKAATGALRAGDTPDAELAAGLRRLEES